ncbi:rhodanese-like domain-containing protein [Cellulomonas sp.]|uniref:rhodanese-like domain-containing protein n=1 Tax=Cellulomonas sp. TaxID=40001 RepID=UPI00258F3040|nr:rhodanese-like domain-containing protein [Cellulomonas sp.]MCR6688491.1 rhodanese-like domain-containing protein [Cellulomonas sp.]
MTTTPMGTPPAHPARSVRDRLLRLLRGTPADGSLKHSVKAAVAIELVAQGATLVDVREAGEWRTGHAPRAVHVPLGQVAQGARRLPKGRPVVVVCASGMRSRAGAQQLRDLGFQATSVSGGMAAWQRAGGEVTR